MNRIITLIISISNYFMLTAHTAMLSGIGRILAVVNFYKINCIVLNRGEFLWQALVFSRILILLTLLLRPYSSGFYSTHDFVYHIRLCLHPTFQTQFKLLFQKQMLLQNMLLSWLILCLDFLKKCVIGFLC